VIKSFRLGDEPKYNTTFKVLYETTYEEYIKNTEENGFPDPKPHRPGIDFYYRISLD